MGCFGGWDHVDVGFAYVACTRARRSWYLVFEDDLSEYEHFMKARGTLAYRHRRCWELRLQKRASITSRNYRYFDEDYWMWVGAGVAHSLIVGLNRIAAKCREILRYRSGSVLDDDS